MFAFVSERLYGLRLLTTVETPCYGLTMLDILASIKKAAESKKKTTQGTIKDDTLVRCVESGQIKTYDEWERAIGEARGRPVRYRNAASMMMMSHTYKAKYLGATWEIVDASGVRLVLLFK